LCRVPTICKPLKRHFPPTQTKRKKIEHAVIRQPFQRLPYRHHRFLLRVRLGKRCGRPTQHASGRQGRCQGQSKQGVRSSKSHCNPPFHINRLGGNPTVVLPCIR